MSGTSKWVILVLSVVILLIGLVYFHTATNNKPDSLKGVVNEVHEKLTPNSHKPEAK